MPIANKNSPDESIIAPSVRLFHVHVKRSKTLSCIIPDIFHFAICTNESIPIFFFVQLPLNVCAQKRALFFSLFLVSTIVDLCLNVMQVSQCKMLYSILVLSTTNALAYFTFCYCYFYFCYPVMYRRSEKNREKKNARNFSHVFVICFTTIQRANEGFGISVTLN